MQPLPQVVPSTPFGNVMAHARLFGSARHGCHDAIRRSGNAGSGYTYNAARFTVTSATTSRAAGRRSADTASAATYRRTDHGAADAGGADRLRALTSKSQRPDRAGRQGDDS